MHAIHLEKNKLVCYQWRGIDGSRLATASESLSIWSDKCELLFTGPKGHSLWGLAWSPDDEKIITGTYTEGIIQVWSKDAKLIKTIE